MLNRNSVCNLQFNSFFLALNCVSLLRPVITVFHAITLVVRSVFFVAGILCFWVNLTVDDGFNFKMRCFICVCVCMLSQKFMTLFERTKNRREFRFAPFCR